ncbi:ATP-binding cassette domain-containing protein [Thermophagus xiamenensis]|uniref:ABC-2 type transport system ATP-binding protein n=1 Tax=Thermophagus xiamenensis TaxID=385682 RepID=A0A1I1WJT8_9BACT|nr:ATP-binding cassette domain-containing protein [Thermophagus xiamenensis]SFD95445.1 ABC-2 type transport system ATP-binding protein [Thermophagus xiamenensis]
MEIVVKELNHFYGPQKALDQLSFKVRTGEILGFLGPNGAGKTTTMKAITGYLTPSEGDVFIDGISVTQNPEQTKKTIGYLPENNPLYGDMPVIDYLIFAGQLQGLEGQKLKDRVREMVRVCGLNTEKHKKIGELSKGYKQRVGLAQALIHDPQVLILDEPTTGLDPNQIIEIRELIRQIGKEKTVLLSSHILAEVEATCDRVLIINKGKLVADGTPEELRKQASGHEILHVSIGGEEDKNKIFKALQDIPQVAVVDFRNDKKSGFEVQSKTGESSAKSIFDMCVNNGWYLTELTPFEKNLEDIFREVTKEQ